MAKRLPKKVKELLEKSKESCLLAVDIYNKPKTSFRSGGYVVLMIIAWTSLLHAIFEKKNVKYYYRDKNNPRLYQKINGERKAWELGECIKEYLKDKDHSYEPIRANINFFLPLRNQIEHRFMPELDNVIFGECQSLLNNFEQILLEEFGEDNCINESLVYSLQFAKTNPKNMGIAPTNDFKRIKEHVIEFRNGLPDEVFGDPKYSFKAALIQTNNPNRADCAIEFIHYDESQPEQMAQLNHVIGVIKEKFTPVSNLGLFKASDVTKKVQKNLTEHYGVKIIFTTHHHNICCLEYNIHPPKDSANKRDTNIDFCTYDEVFDNYVFKPSWIENLTEKLSNKDEFLRIFPQRKKEVLGLLTSTEVGNKVKKELNHYHDSKVKFSYLHNGVCSREYGVRPLAGQPKNDTNEQYCIYNGNDNYLYTPKWVDLLVDKLKDRSEFLRIFPKQSDLIN